MSTSGLAVPPGRAGRPWLVQRLRVAYLTADLLDRKLLILRNEQDRLRSQEHQARQEWEASCAEADQWLLRVALLGRRRLITLAASREPADVAVRYALTVGIGYLAEATYAAPAPGTVEGPALTAACTAATSAVTAAGRYVAAAEAVQKIDAEVNATRYRLRAIKDRWIPRLQDTLAKLERALEEQEHADGVRMRQVFGQAGRPS